jgi:hypothetical protein
MVLQAMCGQKVAEQKNPGQNEAILMLRVAFLFVEVPDACI